MKATIFKVAVLGILLLPLTACSQKATMVDSTSNSSSNQQARPERGERPQFADLLVQMDEDNDGKLSKAEVKGPLQNNFSDIDKDGDGFISETEFKSAPPPQRRPRRN